MLYYTLFVLFWRILFIECDSRDIDHTNWSQRCRYWSKWRRSLSFEARLGWSLENISHWRYHRHYLTKTPVRQRNAEIVRGNSNYILYKKKVQNNTREKAWYMYKYTYILYFYTWINLHRIIRMCYKLSFSQNHPGDIDFNFYFYFNLDREL